MLRAAAKNYQGVAILSDPSDYAAFATELDQSQGATTLATRFRSASVPSHAPQITTRSPAWWCASPTTRGHAWNVRRKSRLTAVDQNASGAGTPGTAPTSPGRPG